MPTAPSPDTFVCDDCTRPFKTQRGLRRHRCDGHDDCYGQIDRHAPGGDRHAAQAQIHLRLGDPLHKKVRVEAKRRGVTVSELVRLAVARFVK